MQPSSARKSCPRWCGRGQQFGMNYIIDVLLGAKNKKILERGHHELSVYGIVDDFSREELRSVITQLVQRKLMVKK